MIYGKELVRMFSEIENDSYNYYIQKQFNSDDSGLALGVAGGAAALGGGFLAAKHGMLGKGAKKWANGLFKSGAKKAETAVAKDTKKAAEETTTPKTFNREIKPGAEGIHTNSDEGEKLMQVINNGGTKEEVKAAKQAYIDKARDGHGSKTLASEQIQATQVANRNLKYSSRYQQAVGMTENGQTMNRAKATQIANEYKASHGGSMEGYGEYLKTYSAYCHYKYRFL